MRLFVVAVAAFCISSAASAEPPPRYAPMQGLLGNGYKHSVEKDGSLRIQTVYQSRDWYSALNVALYRAAELARDAGKPYVQILGGHARSRNFVADALVYASPSESSAAPTACRGRQDTCYTADVAQVLRELSGPSGNQPGVRRPAGTDEFGRTVIHEGFGTGAVSWLRR